MSNPWAPDENHATILSERFWLQGALLSNVFYGMQFTLFFICLDMLFRSFSRSSSKQHLVTIAFLVLVFVMSTLFMFSSVASTERAFIDDRNYPGGPDAYEEQMSEISLSESGNAALMIGQWVMDLLLVWRCIIIYGTCSRPIRLVVTCFVWLLWLGSLVLGTLYLVQSRESSITTAADFTLASGCMSLSINVVVTLLISGRLLLFRRRVLHILGTSHVSQYATFSAILIESACMYTIYLLLFVVTLAINNPVFFVFAQSVGQVQTVASFLIIYRMASGRGWTANTESEVFSQASAGSIQLKSLPSVHPGGLMHLTASSRMSTLPTDHTATGDILSSKDIPVDQLSYAV